TSCVPSDKCGSLTERQPLHRRPDTCGGFFAGQQTIGKNFPRRLEFAAVLQMVVERDQVGATPPAPPPLPIADLIDDDAINPGPQGRLAPEPRERPKDAQKDLLRHI